MMVADPRRFACAATSAIIFEGLRRSKQNRAGSLLMRVLILLALLIGFAAPARADDIAAAQTVIRSQAEAFGRDDAQGAWSYAAPEIHDRFHQADIFLMMVQQGYPPVYRHRSFEFGEA